MACGINYSRMGVSKVYGYGMGKNTLKERYNQLTGVYDKLVAKGNKKGARYVCKKLALIKVKMVNEELGYDYERAKIADEKSIQS